MRLIVWNYQGLGNPRTVLYLKELIRSKNPSVLFLIETKMNSYRLNKIRRQCGFCKGFSVDPIGVAGGLSLWWKPWIEVNILSWNKNWIDTIIRSDAEQTYRRFSWIYGTLYSAEKIEFWEAIDDWDRKDQVPWVVCGDMNEVAWSHEKEGGAPWNPRKRRFLIDFMESNSLADLGFSGQCFTWEKNCGENMIVRERLDRVLGNADWIECWPNTQVSHGLRLGSDHCPLIIDNNPSVYKAKKLFRFEAKWVENPACMDIVQSCWGEETRGSGITNWMRKLAACEKKLSQWSKNLGDNSRRQIQELLTRLEMVQKDVGSLQNQNLHDKLGNYLDSLWKAEELYWCQRSRVNWLKAGDKNTRFFHLSTIQRRQRNRILRLKNK